MALDEKKYRKEWMGGLGKHVVGNALAARLKKKHGPKEEDEAPVEESDLSAPNAHAEGPAGALPPVADEPPAPEAADEDGEPCPHCGHAAAKKVEPKKRGHSLDADSLSLLLRSRGG